MALLTARAELPVMGIVLAMAGNAGPGDGRYGLALGGSGLVAALATGLQVSSCQCKTGPRVMVEIPCAPRASVVASLTALAEAGLVLVRLEVAGHAFLDGVFEPVGFMAALARNPHVPSGQGKCREVVVEHCAAPLRIGVATVAAATQLPVVLVILLVATHALQWGVTKLVGSGVARLALHPRLCMPVAQGKASAVMPEAAVRPLPVPLCVTDCTFGAQGGFVHIVLAVARSAAFGRFFE